MNKLQELTDKLYNEGLSKGREAGERLIEEARADAGRIRKDAEARAEEIIAKAESQAAEIKAKADSDIRMAAGQSLQATRKDIEDLLVGAICSDKVPKALDDKDFIKEIISCVAGKFSLQESSDIALLLPESMKSELESWVKDELAGTLSTNIEASFSKKISGGFTIGPKDGSYFVSLTDGTFKDLICEYLRPVTRRILFGE